MVFAAAELDTFAAAREARLCPKQAQQNHCGIFQWKKGPGVVLAAENAVHCMTLVNSGNTGLLGGGGGPLGSKRLLPASSVLSQLWLILLQANLRKPCYCKSEPKCQQKGQTVLESWQLLLAMFHDMLGCVPLDVGWEYCWLQYHTAKC